MMEAVKRNCNRKAMFTLVSCGLMLINGAVFIPTSQADVLRGGVRQDNEILRIAPPRSDGQGVGQNSGNPHSLRVSRDSMPMLNSQSPTVDTSAFSPMNGQADKKAFEAGVADQFSAPPKSFDIGTERQSREMMLAWERWHHQLSGAIYERWSERADVPGKATLRIVVTRDHHIVPTIIDSGGRHFDRGLMQAIMSLDGNPGLTFPSKSQRQEVAFEADYIAGSDVHPGYSWVKNDYEKVNESN
jgi:hypothetical protein